MIASFGDPATEDLYHGQRSPHGLSFPADLPADLRTAILQKLDMIQAARILEDLRAPSGNPLEALTGPFRGYHSFRINDQWRVCFRFVDGDAYDVEITDYH